MLYAPTGEQSRVTEERAVASGAVTLSQLMERAGRAVAHQGLDLAPAGRIAVIAGKGNNGGDGWVAARVLKEAGRDVVVFSVAPPDQATEPAASAVRAAIAGGVRWSSARSGTKMPQALGEAALVVDALLGTGFHGPAREPYSEMLAAMRATAAPILSVDVPSGVDASTGAADRLAVKAAVTVTFTAPKAGLLLYPGADHTGEILVADIGLTEEDLRGAVTVGARSREEWSKLLPIPRSDDHKNSRGRVLVVAGSPGMAGSAALCATGALRMGAGYVRLASPESIGDVLATKLTCVVLAALPDTPKGAIASGATDRVLGLAGHADAVVLGPGLTTAPQAVKLVRRLVRELRVPLVLDADGLNALSSEAERILSAREAPTVLTPHPGELARLLGVSVSDVQSDRLSAGARLASDRVAVVLKGARTVVSGEGRQLINMTGNPGMATAGTGDVLAGMIGTLLAQGLSPLDAGGLGAHLHGRAGDFAALELTETCVTAEDVLAYLPSAVKELLGS